MRPRQTASAKLKTIYLGEATEKDEGDVDVEGQSGCSCNGVCDTEYCTCLCQVVLSSIKYKAEIPSSNNS